MDIFERIQLGEFDNKAYPSSESIPKELTLRIEKAKRELDASTSAKSEWLDKAMREYEEAESLSVSRLRSALEDEFEMKGHPKSETLWDRAWSMGHSEGRKRVAHCYGEFLGLVK